MACSTFPTFSNFWFLALDCKLLRGWGQVLIQFELPFWVPRPARLHWMVGWEKDWPSPICGCLVFSPVSRCECELQGVNFLECSSYSWQSFYIGSKDMDGRVSFLALELDNLPSPKRTAYRIQSNCSMSCTNRCRFIYVHAQGNHMWMHVVACLYCTANINILYIYIL